MTCSPFPLNVGSTTLTRGDTWSQEFWFENPDATRIDLDAEGWANWRSWLVETPFEVDASRASEGVIELKMNSEMSRNAKAGAYDLEATNGDEVRTWIRGQFRFDEDVTK